MKFCYRPVIRDSGNRIKNTVAAIQKSTGMKKAVILENLLIHAIRHLESAGNITNILSDKEEK